MKTADTAHSPLSFLNVITSVTPSTTPCQLPTRVLVPVEVVVVVVVTGASPTRVHSREPLSPATSQVNESLSLAALRVTVAPSIQVTPTGILTNFCVYVRTPSAYFGFCPADEPYVLPFFT